MKINTKLILAASIAASTDNSRPTIQCVNVRFHGNGFIEYRGVNGRIAVRIREREAVEREGEASITPDVIKVIRALKPESVRVDFVESLPSLVINNQISALCFDHSKATKYPSFSEIMADEPCSKSAHARVALDRSLFGKLFSALRTALPKENQIQVTTNEDGEFAPVHVHSRRGMDITFDGVIMPLRIR